jgi:hypothetical protein
MPVDNTNVVMPNPLLPQIKQLVRKVGEFAAYDVGRVGDEDKALLRESGAKDELEGWLVAAKMVAVSG